MTLQSALSKNYEFIIFSDGACLGNPGRGGAAYILIDDNLVYEFVETAEETTNNRMEIIALLRALQRIAELKPATSEFPSIIAYTDSHYLVQALTQWLPSWRRRHWMTATGDPVKNRDLWELFDSRWLKTLTLEHIRGHQGIDGNERCDQLATGAAAGKTMDLYRGPRKNYPVSLAVPKSSKKIEPYYLSYINGVLARDTTWKDCEARVKGQKSAKYKKVHSEHEEIRTLESWGIQTDDLCS